MKINTKTADRAERSVERLQCRFHEIIGQIKKQMHKLQSS